MNCKKGDIAIIVRSSSNHEGKIVTCEEFLGQKIVIMPGQKTQTLNIWRIDRTLPAWNGVEVDQFPDEFLRPIRDHDDDQVDEMLKLVQPDSVDA